MSVPTDEHAQKQLQVIPPLDYSSLSKYFYINILRGNFIRHYDKKRDKVSSILFVICICI